MSTSTNTQPRGLTTSLPHLARRFIRRPLLTDDLCQDIELESFEKNIPITYALVRSRSYDFLRKERRDKRMLEQAAVAKGRRIESKPTGEHEVNTRNILLQVFTRAQLTSDAESWLYKRFFLDMSYKEISEVVSYHPAYVSTVINEAISKLRKAAQELEGETKKERKV